MNRREFRKRRRELGFTWRNIWRKAIILSEMGEDVTVESISASVFLDCDQNLLMKARLEWDWDEFLERLLEWIKFILPIILIFI